MRGRRAVKPPIEADDVVPMPGAMARIPDPPPELKSHWELECWNRTAAILISKNTYDVDTADMLAAYCVQRGRFLEANDDVRKRGSLIPVHRSIARGRHARALVIQNPNLAISNAAFKLMVKLAFKLGLTPATRKSGKPVNKANQVTPLNIGPKPAATPAMKFFKAK